MGWFSKKEKSGLEGTPQELTFLRAKRKIAEEKRKLSDDIAKEKAAIKKANNSFSLKGLLNGFEETKNHPFLKNTAQNLMRSDFNQGSRKKGGRLF